MKKSGLITIIVIIILVAAGVFAISHKSTKSTYGNTTSSNSTAPSSKTSANQTQQTTPTNNQQTASTITYSGNGFSPSTLTVKAGAPITIKNDSSGQLQFDSDPHPVHTDNPELNIGEIAAGQSKTLTISKTGSWGYHNHLNPSDTGTIVVQ